MRATYELAGHLVWLACLCCLVWAGGCALLRVPEEPPRPTPTKPLWQDDALREHLRVFNSSTMAGRATGTQGYARTAAYVTDRLREYRLQPAVGGEFRVVYGSPFNYPRRASLWTTGADSLVFVPGMDFLPDGRTDSGRVHIRHLVVAPDADAPPTAALGGDTALLVTTGGATDGLLAQARAARAAAVIAVGELVPNVYPNPVPGLPVVQVTAEALAALLDVPPELVPALLARRGDRIPLSAPAVLRVVTDRMPLGGGLNVVGYVAGKHPVLSREAVLVCADLDAVGHIAGVRTFDFGHFGRGAAAVLALAQHYGFVSRWWNVPDRTIIFAVWSGARLGHRGLRAYLDHPSWALARLRAVVYAGLAADEVPAVADLVGGYGVPLYAVPLPGEPLAGRATHLQPDPTALRLGRTRAASSSPPPRTDLSAVIARAAGDARALAEAAYAVILRETTSPAPLPVLSDTLALPAPSSE